MSMSICGVDRTMSRRGLHGMRFMHGGMHFMDCMRSTMHEMHSMHGTHSIHGVRSIHGMHKFDATEIATRMMNNGDEDGDGALSTNELVKLIERKDLVGADFHKKGPIDEESTDVISETQSSADTVAADAASETQSISDTVPDDAVSETQGGSDTEPVAVISEPQGIIDLVKQLLSRLDLSEEETENFIETMRDYGIDMTV